MFILNLNSENKNLKQQKLWLRNLLDLNKLECYYCACQSGDSKKKNVINDMDYFLYYEYRWLLAVVFFNIRTFVFSTTNFLST